MSYVKLFFFLFALFSCSSKKDAEGVLRGFITERFQGGQTKAEILKSVTGGLREEIENMTDEEFKIFSNVDNYQKKSVDISLKNCTDNKCFITYIVKYDFGKADKNYRGTIETKKIAELVKAEGEWKIADVSDIKTYLDGQSELSTPPNQPTP